MKDGWMTFREAGKRGGAATKKKHGTGHFSEIGRKGGETNVRKGTDFAALGRLGGLAKAERRRLAAAELKTT